MGKFLESEKLRLAEFKANSPYFTDDARREGSYKDKPRPFCLPDECAEQNLVPEIRETAPSFFAKHEIKWHDGQNGKPSNHLCDSQVCCVNFLFPFTNQPDGLAKVLCHIYPDLEVMLPVEDGHFVSFECIGQKNYLGEKITRNGKRTRGANFTSADAIVKFRLNDKRIQVVLIEWKYSESYGGTNLKFALSGTDRTKIYQPLFDLPDCPIDKQILPHFDDLFFEPFYQFMRQQLLAHEMEKAHELDADIVSVLHIAPASNLDFRRITSPELRKLGDTATGAWSNLVANPGRFLSVSTESLFGRLSVQKIPEMKPWLEYIHARYSWVG